MPCSVSRQEMEHYEKLYNQEQFGVEWADAELTEAVACGFHKLLQERMTPEEIERLPKYVLGWIIAHEAKDKQREEEI